MMEPLRPQNSLPPTRRRENRTRRDLAIIAIASVILFWAAALTDFTRQFIDPLVHWPGDFLKLHELFVVLIFLAFAFAVFSWRRMTELRRDYLELRKAEDELRLYKTIIESSREAIAISDAEGKFLYINPAHEKLFGRSLEEARNLNYRDYYPPEAIDVLNTTVAPALARGESWEGELDVLDVNGRRFPLWERADSILDENGRFLYAFGFMHDITLQRRAVEELQYRMEFEKLIAFLSSTFVNLEPSETDREINNALQRIGEFCQVDRSYVFQFTDGSTRMYNSHEWCARGISPFILSLQSIPIDTFPRLMEKLLAFEVFHVPCVEDLPPDAQAEKEEFSREGIQSLVCVPMIYRGILLGFMGFDSVREQKAWSDDTIALLKLVGEVFTNALVRKRAEENLRASEERFSVFMDHLPAAAFIKDAEGRVVYVNRYLRALFGWTDWQGKFTYDLLSPEMSEQMMADDRQALSGSLVSRIEKIIDADGAERLFQTLKFPVSMANQTPLLGGFSLDITESRRADEERRKIEAQMQHTQKLESLGVLAGGIAHDFNNLLTTMLGHAGLALMELPPRSPARENVEQIEIAGRRAAELTKQMLAYAGKGALITQVLRLSDIVREMSHLLEVTVSRKCVLNYNIPDSLPPIEGDPTQLRQVIMNLILNAAESLHDQTGAIAVSMGVMYCGRPYLNSFHLGEEIPEGDYVYLEVEDTGCGMTPEILSRIFDPFFTTKFTGRGLGLAAVLGIVRSHQGAIRVSSVPGQGSVFRVLFPVSAQSLDDTPDSVQATPVWRGSGTVLVIDDEESVRNLASLMLRKMGFTVLLACDGVEGLDVFNLHRNEIRAVLLDMTMPRMDGRETFKEIRRIHPGARVILSSGYSEQDATAHIQEQGLAGFVQKPYRMEDLMSVIRKALEGEGKFDVE